MLLPETQSAEQLDEQARTALAAFVRKRIGEGSGPYRAASEGKLPWSADEGADWFGEIATIRLRDGALLAALRRQLLGTEGEGFEDTVITRSEDDGRTWTAPQPLLNTAEVHGYLTKLSDGRILVTYSNYHLPYAACATVSEDGGRTWDRNNVVVLNWSADLYVGWPVTLELPDGSLLTSYATTTYLKQPPDTTTCEIVRWRLPE